jgi:hypothetical protein
MSAQNCQKDAKATNFQDLTSVNASIEIDSIKGCGYAWEWNTTKVKPLALKYSILKALSDDASEIDMAGCSTPCHLTWLVGINAS